MKLILTCIVTVSFLLGLVYLLSLVFDRNERAVAVIRWNERKTAGYAIAETIGHLLIYGTLLYLLENAHD